MKNSKVIFLFITLVLFNFLSCEFGTPTDEGELYKIKIAGQVVNNVSGDGIPDAAVKITDGTETVQTSSNNVGAFNAEFEIFEDTELSIITNKQGFRTDTSKFFAAITSEQIKPLIQLTPTDTITISDSGAAASVYLYSQSDNSLGVKESGSNESVQFIFQVLDSTGTPIGLNNIVTVHFILSSGPGGGEYLYPSSKETNVLGRASVTLNSGTVAGVVQVVAEIQSANGVIRSKPILISVHGGFPDEQHFDVACDLLNYPALGLIGYEIPFTAFIGDKYTNPVRPGTSVYFNTTSGIIDGSNLTDELGRATVTLLTQGGPNHPQYGPGFFEVTASTVNENQQSIETRTIRLLSGKPIITVTPTTFDLQNGGSQVFNYTVSDANNNPLSEGTNINVTVSEGDVKLLGDTEIRLPDTQSRAYTNFSFTVYDAIPDSSSENQAIIEISTSGNNGDAKLKIVGRAR